MATATAAARAMTPAPPIKTRASPAAPASKVALEDGEPLEIVPLSPLGEDMVPFPDTGTIGADVMVLVLVDRDGDVEVVVSTLLLDEGVLEG